MTYHSQWEIWVWIWIVLPLWRCLGICHTNCRPTVCSGCHWMISKCRLSLTVCEWYTVIKIFILNLYLCDSLMGRNEGPQLPAICVTLGIKSWPSVVAMVWGLEVWVQYINLFYASCFHFMVCLQRCNPHHNWRSIWIASHSVIIISWKHLEWLCCPGGKNELRNERMPM